MSDDSDDIGVDYGTVLYRFIRKIVIFCAVIFVLYTFATQSYKGNFPPKPNLPANTVTNLADVTVEQAPNVAVIPPTPPAAASDSTPLEPNTNRINQKIETLEIRLKTAEELAASAKQEKTVPVTSPGEVINKEMILHLQEQLVEQEKILQALKAQLSEVENVKNHMVEVQSRNARQLSALTNLGIIKDIIARGESFSEPLDQMYKLLPQDGTNKEHISTLLDRLKPYAGKGIPTWSVLQQKFDYTLTLALHPQEIDHSWQQNIRSLIRIRKEGAYQRGKDDEAVLARAEAHLSQHELKGALKELANLSPLSAIIFTNWTKQAQSFELACMTLDELQLALVSTTTDTIAGTTEQITPAPTELTAPAASHD